MTEFLYMQSKEALNSEVKRSETKQLDAQIIWGPTTHDPRPKTEKPVFNSQLIG